MRTLWQDIRYGSRMLGKNPGFTMIVVLVLALGIGANTALFSVIHSVLLSHLPFPEPRQLVMLQTYWTNEPGTSSVSGPDYLDWAERNTVFSSLCVYARSTLNLTGRGEPMALMGCKVSASFTNVIRNEMVLGRGLTPDASKPGGNPNVAMLTYGLWRDRFDADPDIVGQTISLDNTPHAVIGVAAPLPGFIEDQVQVFVPLSESRLAALNRNYHYLVAIGRLKPNITLGQAQEAMNHLAAQIEKEHPKENQFKRVRITSLRDMIVGYLEMPFIILYGAVTLLLLVACTNVSNLLLARAKMRQHELSVRRSLGASRGRILRQLLTESLILALLGGALGLFFAFWGLDLLRFIAPRIEYSQSGIPGLAEIGINLPILGFTLLVSLFTGFFFGLIPAWQGSGSCLNLHMEDTLNQLSFRRKKHSTLSLLATIQMALALVLLSGTGLLVKSFAKLRLTDPGFDPSQVLALRVVQPQNKDTEQARHFFHQTINQLTAIPGVEAACAINLHPLAYGNMRNGTRIIGKPGWHETEVRLISPAYFDCLSIPLLQGRKFTAQDDSNPNVAIVNKEFVRRYLSNHNPLSHTLEFWGRETPIIGVVDNIKEDSLHAQGYEPFLYIPTARHCERAMTLLVRTKGDPAQWADTARKTIWNIDRTQPILYAETMDHLVLRSLSFDRFCLILLAIMGGVALLLALVGLYGVMTFVINARYNEIGIRMALGAEAGDILALVMKKALVLTVAGLVVGFACALTASRFLTSMLHNTRTWDPVTFIFVPILLFTVAMMACYIPARRASKIDPMKALRYE